MLLRLNSAYQNGSGATGGERLVLGLRERSYRGQGRSARNSNDAEKCIFHGIGCSGLLLPSLGAKRKFVWCLRYCRSLIEYYVTG